MSVAYFIAFDKPLSKTNYQYKYIFEDKWILFEEDDGVLFEDNLSGQEKIALGTLFNQRKVYSIMSTIPFETIVKNKGEIKEGYYEHQLLLLKWFKSFIKKQLAQNGDILFFKTNIGEKPHYEKITCDYVDIDKWNIDSNFFKFDNNVIYQFVDNSK